MDLANAGRYFSQDPVYDAYTGALLFHCRTSAHDDHSSSGATSRRRTMTTDPAVVAPARGVVRLYDEHWVIASSNPDFFRGQAVRRNFDLKKSTGLMAILTPAAACLSLAGTEFYAHKEYFRDNVDTRTSADMDTMWNIFCPRAEAIVKGTFLRQGSTLFRVRNIYPSIEAVNIAEADQLDEDALQVATFNTGTLNLVTDRYEGAQVAVPVIQTDLQKFYRFQLEADPTHKPGDRTVFAPKSLVTPKVGQTFTMQGQTFQVVTVVSEFDVWALRVRLA